MRCLLLSLWMILGVNVSVGAEPRFARIFGDHAVLQRDNSIAVWGSGADPASRLQVRFGKSDVTAIVEHDGRWKADLPKQGASDQGKELELLENGTRVTAIEDVVVGDVWLAAGQSNMQFQVRSMRKGLPESQGWIDSAMRTQIRFRRIDDPVAEGRNKEASDLAQSAAWVRMTPESVLNFSAVATVFARELSEDLDVPVGVVDVSWGGKPIEPFIPRETFSDGLLKQIRELADQHKLDELAKLRGGVIIRNPEGHPGAIFNARIAPVIPYRVRGFIWYQAESNAGKGEDPRQYRFKMEALIHGWRTRWKNDTLPFYFVQLPSFPNATGWIRMREEQRRALAVNDTGMAVTIDIRGDGIHPPDKIAVGQRLARLALSKTYNQTDVIPSGPIYRGHQIQSGAVRVQFTDIGGGLMIGDKPDFGPPRQTPHAPLRWFELAGVDGVWHAAEASIEGDSVVVTSSAVPAPVAVRYACDTEPQGGNLYNQAGLPASPFCSDLKYIPWIDFR